MDEKINQELIDMKTLEIGEQDKKLREMFDVKTEDFKATEKVIMYLSGHATISGNAELSILLMNILKYTKEIKELNNKHSL